MGTNYYAVRNRPSTYGGIHIGLSSIGWKFLFQEISDPWHYPPIEWHTWNQVEGWLYRNCVEKTDFVIMNEYDEIVSFDEFVDLVEFKQNDEQSKNNPRNFEFCKNVDGYRFTDGDFS